MCNGLSLLNANDSSASEDNEQLRVTMDFEAHQKRISLSHFANLCGALDKIELVGPLSGCPNTPLHMNSDKSLLGV